MASSVGAFFVLLLAVIVFLLCREIVCWYFRLTHFEDQLNKIIALLGREEKANDLLKIKKK